MARNTEPDDIKLYRAYAERGAEERARANAEKAMRKPSVRKPARSKSRQRSR